MRSPSDSAVAYIQRHYQPDDRLCVALIKREGESAHIKQEFATARQICEPKFQAHLRAANANGSDIYLTVNALHEGARSRTKSDIGTVRHLYVDIDERGPEVVSAILASDMPKPSAIIESSKDRFQVLWRVDGFSKDQAEATVRSIAHRFGADEAVWDSARVLRLPGYRNTKREGDWFTQVVPGQHRTEQVLAPSDFPAFPAPDLLIVRERIAPKHVGPAMARSRSEHDWAETMKALERGESPADIRAALEQTRQDKPNPAYYAQRTVDRAVEQFQMKAHGPRIKHQPKRGRLPELQRELERCDREIAGAQSRLEHNAYELLGLEDWRIERRLIMADMEYQAKQQHTPEQKPVAKMTLQEIKDEIRTQQDRFATIRSEFDEAPPEQKPELRREMRAIVARENQLQTAAPVQTIAPDRVPEREISYSR